MKDLVVIGGGPGGYVAAIRAGQLGMSVSLIEKNTLGGTCLNRGCIPTKVYYQNAAVLRTLDRLSEYNVHAGQITFDMAGARERKNHIVASIVSGIEDLLKAGQVEVIRGKAAIVGPGSVLVEGEEIKARHILLATGSYPVRLPIPGAELPGVLTSDEMLELTESPRRLAIIGGGVIGMEFACIFNAFGSQVTVFEGAPVILGALDKEIAKRMGVFLKRQKITTHVQAAVRRIEQKEDTLTVIADGRKGSLECDVDTVLVAAGRRPYIQCLGIENLGIVCRDGYISVDENFETSLRRVYAVGDVIGGPMLAHLASEEGIAAVERMCGLPAAVDYEAVPSCIFSFPEIATVGLSQEEVDAKGMGCKIGKFQFAANGKALAMGEAEGIVKVIAALDGTVAGIHIIGPHASDLIQEASLIVKNRMKLKDVIKTIHPHPTLGEALHEAAMDAEGMAIHLRPKRQI